MGTTNSWIYESTDEGGSWHRLAKLDKPDDLVIDHILVDPRDSSLIYAAAWKLDHPDGGLWISNANGKTWNASRACRDNSAPRAAPSNFRILIAGP
jgi:photosystem II stability/assembly factor-like uncharacterized protein